jgi:hypothetical protein
MAEKLSDEDLLECATMPTLLNGRSVYVAEPEQTSDNGLVAGVSRYSFRWRTTAFAACASLARRGLRKRSNPDCPSKSGNEQY